MSEQGQATGVLTKVIILLAILIIGWNLYTGATIKEVGIPGIFTVKFGEGEDTTIKPDDPDNGDSDVFKVRKYLMDNQSNRIIMVSHLQNNKYRIEEASSPWPWEGKATIDGGQLIGEARFINSLATMRVEGVIRGDDSIVIEYKFITGSDGKPSTGRIDNHVWYLTK